MSVEYWPIILYGISSENIGDIMAPDYTEDIWDTFETATEEHPYLSWASNGDGIYYLGLSPSYPWGVIGPDTKEHVQEGIYTALKPYLLPKTTREEMDALCDYFNEVGIG